MLTAEEVEGFVSDGFVYLPGAFPRALADECRAFLWRETGADPDDPATWTRPVIRLDGYGGELFNAAVNTPALHEAFDQLAGAGRWVPRTGLGTFPIRFPHPDDPGDAGWHMEGSFSIEGEQGYCLNLRSRGRALLMLFLFSEVGPDDAPTRIQVGSHLDVPPFLVPAGDQGMSVMAACTAMHAAGKLYSPDRKQARATGHPGDVYLCHPFLIHAAQPHRGREPRFMAQPPLDPVAPLDLRRADGAYSPVERAVLRGLGGQADLPIARTGPIRYRLRHVPPLCVTGTRGRGPRRCHVHAGAWWRRSPEELSCFFCRPTGLCCACPMRAPRSSLRSPDACATGSSPSPCSSR